MRARKTTKVGKIIIPDGANVWPHELESAKVLARYGHTVEFLKTNNQKGQQTADCRIDGSIWEMKAIERELRKRFAEIKGIKRIKFINRHAQVVDIP